MKNKLGTYIQSLMSTIVDKEEKKFNVGLAWDELKRLNVNIEEFLRKHAQDDSKDREKTEKILLQEDKNVKDK